MPSSNAVQVAKAAAGKEALPGPSPRLQAQLSQLQKRPAGEVTEPLRTSLPSLTPGTPRAAGRLEKRQCRRVACGRPDGFDLGDNGTWDAGEQMEAQGLDVAKWGVSRQLLCFLRLCL